MGADRARTIEEALPCGRPIDQRHRAERMGCAIDRVARVRVRTVRISPAVVGGRTRATASSGRGWTGALCVPSPDRGARGASTARIDSFDRSLLLRDEGELPSADL